MTGHDRAVDRRTVIKTAGGAIGVAVIGAGVASADHFSYGQCVVTVTRTPMYERACPAENFVREVDGGTEGQVHDWCTTDDGDEWVYFSANDAIIPANWVPANYLDPC
jgi:hypothetical protein